MSRVEVLCHGLKDNERIELEKIFSKNIDIYMEAKGIHNSKVGSDEWKQELRADGICEEDINMTLEEIIKLRNNKKNINYD